MLPSGPATIPCSPLLAVGTGYSVTTPLVVIRATLFAAISRNHRLPSGPAAISVGWPPATVDMGYSVKAPLVVTLASLPAPASVTHRLPSGPAAIPHGVAPPVGRGYSVKAPLGV